MANDKHVELLRQGVETWNKWVQQNPTTPVDLSWASFRGANLRGADFSGADLRRATFRGARLNGSLAVGRREGDETPPDLVKAAAEIDAVLRKGGPRRGQNVRGPIFAGANFNGIILTTANLQGANFNGADISGANFINAKLDGVEFAGADLDGSDFALLKIDTGRDDKKGGFFGRFR